jgi:hypothetical protein
VSADRAVDRAEVERIAHLARLALDEGELERLTVDMNDILGHANALRELAHAAPPGQEASEQGTPAEGEGVVPIDRRPAGGTGLSAAEPDSPPEGTRHAAADTPDPLLASPETFAPRVAEGFFVVPPPPGVTAEDNRDEHEPADRG